MHSRQPRPVLPVLFAVAALLAAFTALHAVAREDADVSGTWEMTVESSQGTAHPSLLLRQDGSRISGTYRGRLGEVPLHGTLRESRIQFSVTLKFQDQPITVTYTGTVDKEAMKGTAQFGDNGSGNWSAKRKS